MKLFSCILCTALMLVGCRDTSSPGSPGGPGGYTVIQGSIQGTLSLAGSPYKAIATLVVDSLKTLTIESGVSIYFGDSVQLIVRGKLSCSGNPAQPILLTSHGNWSGIRFEGSPVSSSMRFAVVESVNVVSSADTSLNGALDIRNTAVTIRNCIFRHNSSRNGGAIYLDRAHAFITNNLFIHNSAVSFGGAMVSSSSTNQIINNTFAGNSCANYGGGLVLADPVRDVVENNIFFMNDCRTGDPRIALVNASPSGYDARYNFPVTVGPDPLFVSATDYHLGFGSPCIDAGNPDSVYNDSNGTRNDQGAYGGPLGNW